MTKAALLTTDASSDPRYARYGETHARSVRVVCVKCGSQCIDQNFTDQLMCYTCGNTAPWDGSRFTLARTPHEDHDVLNAFQRNPMQVEAV